MSRNGSFRGAIAHRRLKEVYLALQKYKQELRHISHLVDAHHDVGVSTSLNGKDESIFEEVGRGSGALASLSLDDFPTLSANEEEKPSSLTSTEGDYGVFPTRSEEEEFRTEGRRGSQLSVVEANEEKLIVAAGSVLDDLHTDFRDILLSLHSKVTEAHEVQKSLQQSLTKAKERENDHLTHLQQLEFELASQQSDLRSAKEISRRVQILEAENRDLRDQTRRASGEERRRSTRLISAPHQSTSHSLTAGKIPKLDLRSLQHKRSEAASPVSSSAESEEDLEGADVFFSSCRDYLAPPEVAEFRLYFQKLIGWDDEEHTDVLHSLRMSVPSILRECSRFWSQCLILTEELDWIEHDFLHQGMILEDLLAHRWRRKSTTVGGPPGETRQLWTLLTSARQQQTTAETARIAAENEIRTLRSHVTIVQKKLNEVEVPSGESGTTCKWLQKDVEILCRNLANAHWKGLLTPKEDFDRLSDYSRQAFELECAKRPNPPASNRRYRHHRLCAPQPRVGEVLAYSRRRSSDRDQQRREATQSVEEDEGIAARSAVALWEAFDEETRGEGATAASPVVHAAASYLSSLPETLSRRFSSSRIIGEKEEEEDGKKSIFEERKIFSPPKFLPNVSSFLSSTHSEEGPTAPAASPGGWMEWAQGAAVKAQTEVKRKLDEMVPPQVDTDGAKRRGGDLSSSSAVYLPSLPRGRRKKVDHSIKKPQ